VSAAKPVGNGSNAFGAGKHEEWKRRKRVLSGVVLAFLALVVYGIIMTPLLSFRKKKVGLVFGCLLVLR